MSSFYTKIVGVTFEDRQRLISRLNRRGELASGTRLRLVPEPDNCYDPYAVKVVTMKDEQLGYISKEINKNIHINLLRGRQYFVTVSSVSGGQSDEQNYGINIEVRLI